MPQLLLSFFVHLLILEDPDHHQNLISSLLYHPGPLHEISLQFIFNVLSNVTDKSRLPKRLDEALEECRLPRHIITPILPLVSISQVCRSLKICISECRAWVVKGNSQASGSLPAPPSGHTTAITVFFVHLLIYEDPNCHQHLLSSLLCHSGVWTTL